MDILSRHSTPHVCLIALAATLSIHGRSNDLNIANSGLSQRRIHTLSKAIGFIVSAHKRLLQPKKETSTTRGIERGRKAAASRVSDHSEDPAATMMSAAG